MSICGQTERIRQQLIGGSLNHRSLTSHLVGIGPWLSLQLQRDGIRTLGELVGRLNTMSVADARVFLSSVLRNKHANRCNQFGPGSYHVADVNTCGYNNVATMVSLLRGLLLQNEQFGTLLATRWPGVQAVTLPAIPLQTVREQAPKECGCLRAQQCQQAVDTCRWWPPIEGRRGHCTPRNPRALGFDGVGDLARGRLLMGQKRERGRVPHRRYVQGWVVPVGQCEDSRCTPTEQLRR